MCPGALAAASDQHDSDMDTSEDNDETTTVTTLVANGCVNGPSSSDRRPNYAHDNLATDIFDDSDAGDDHAVNCDSAMGTPLRILIV